MEVLEFSSKFLKNVLDGFVVIASEEKKGGRQKPQAIEQSNRVVGRILTLQKAKQNLVFKEGTRSVLLSVAIVWRIWFKEIHNSFVLGMQKEKKKSPNKVNEDSHLGTTTKRLNPYYKI